MKGNMQFKLRLNEEFVARIEELALKYNRRSANEIAAEIVMEFLDIWEQAEAAKRGILDQHKKLVKQSSARIARKS